MLIYLSQKVEFTECNPMEQVIINTSQKYFLDVWLNRPEKYNALNLSMIDSLIEILEDVDVEKHRFLLLRGKGKSFCSGADLNDFISDNKEMFVKQLSTLLYKLYNCPLPVISIVHGTVYGGGLGLLAVSDIVIADAKSQFCFSEVKLGMVPALISPYLLSKVNKAMLRYLMFSAEVFDNNIALSLGLINKTIDIGVDNAIKNEINKYLSNSPLALRTTKNLLNTITSSKTILSDRKTTEDLLHAHLTEEETFNGINAFLKKEKPDWII